MKELPDWLVIILAGSLSGEIYPAIRGIAAAYSSNEKTLLLRTYFDREPTEHDVENIEVICTRISSMTSRSQIAVADIECVYSMEPMGRLDALDGFVYSRSEIAAGVPYLSGPYAWTD